MAQRPNLPDQEQVRSQFPALSGPTVFLENAGGSQVPGFVADRIYNYMTKTYVQLGAGYGLSQQCTATVDEAHAFARTFLNVGDGQAILGSSSTALLNILADSYGRVLKPGQKIILAETGHEANLGCWKRLERFGIEVVWWRMDPEKLVCPLEDLEKLLDKDTALVALTHVSNLLGEIIDLAAVAEMVHAVGARVVADGVAFAPHRAVDVQALGVDWYVYSTYKVYGPHMAVMFGKRDALAELTGPNHFFIPDDEVPYKFEPGGASHESCAGLLGLGDYLKFLTGTDASAACDRAVVEQAFARMAAWEEPLIERLLAYLNNRKDVRVIGPAHGGPDRVGTISFIHDSKSSREISDAVDKSEVAIRFGHMYAWHLCDRLGLGLEDGVVRVSFVHYNTLAEIDRLIEVFEEIL